MDASDRSIAGEIMASIPNLPTSPDFPANVQQAFALQTLYDGTADVRPIIVQTAVGQRQLNIARDLTNMKVVMETQIPSAGPGEKYSYFVHYQEPNGAIGRRLEKSAWQKALGSETGQNRRSIPCQLRQVTIQEAKRLIGSDGWKPVPSDLLSTRTTNGVVPNPNLLLNSPEASAPEYTQKKDRKPLPTKFNLKD